MADDLPKLPAGAPIAPEGQRYKEQYGLVLVCPDEATQALIYKALSAMGGCKIKVVVT